MKSANEILRDHGIDTMRMNDEFNTQLFHAMERYAEAYAAANPKEPETVHGNEAEKVVCHDCGSEKIYRSNSDPNGGICDDCGYEW